MEYWSFAVILATFLGPAFAIQVQKSIERNRARSQDKEAVFRMLMSTRATRLSEEHVRALNTIDLAYRGGLPKKRSRGETEVINRWTEYRGHLFIDQRDLTESQKERWVSDADSGFSSLLEAMAKERGYVFDKHSLGRGGYSPMAHGYMQVLSYGSWLYAGTAGARKAFAAPNSKRGKTDTYVLKRLAGYFTME